MHRALRDGCRCRSAYKLLEMDDKYHFLNPGSKVVCQAIYYWMLEICHFLKGLLHVTNTS